MLIQTYTHGFVFMGGMLDKMSRVNGFGALNILNNEFKKEPIGINKSRYSRSSVWRAGISLDVCRAYHKTHIELG